MSRIATCAVLSLALLCALSPADPVDLLSNGGFERGDWEWSSIWGHAGHRVVRDEAHSGAASMAFSAQGSISSLEYACDGGPVRVTGWYKLRDVKTGAKPWYRFWISVNYYDKDRAGLGHADYLFADGTCDWTRFDTELPAREGAAFLKLAASLHNCTGEAWVDDLQVHADARLDWPPWEFAEQPYYTGTVLPTPQSCSYGEIIPIHTSQDDRPTLRVRMGDKPSRGAVFGDDQIRFRLEACERFVRFSGGAETSGEDVRVTLGSYDEPTVRRVARRMGWSLPEPIEQGHLVRMARRAGGWEVLAAGADDRGVVYAAASLVQMIGIADGTLVLRAFQLEDRPAFRYRAGGDYGPVGPAMMARLAMNKCSTYAVQHRSWWRGADPDTPYGSTGRTYGEVVETMREWCESTGALDLMSLLHIYVPGGRPLDQIGPMFDIADEQDVTDLIDRLKWLYHGGFRIQMVCVDDYVEARGREYVCKTDAEEERFGSIGRAHGYLMRRLWEALAPDCPDLKLSIVPGPYSLAHMERQVIPEAGAAYLRDMATEMPDEVAVVWTGPRITSPTIERRDWVRYQRLVPAQPLYIWDNNEGLKPVPGFDIDYYPGIVRDSAWGLMYQNAHFVGWPHTMAAHLAANDYMWNPEAYAPRRSHEQSMHKAFGPVSYADVLAVNEGHDLARRLIRGGDFDRETLVSTVRSVYESIENLEAMGVPTSVSRRQLSAAGVVPTIQQRMDQLPVACVPKVSSAPTIDGDVDEVAWSEAVALRPFAHYRDTETTNYKGDVYPTAVRVTYDDDALYIACSCAHGAVELRMHGDIGKRDASIFFGSDAVEVFLSPAPANPTYAHLVVDHTNTVFDEMPKGNAHWDGEWQSAVSKTDGTWHLEMRVPFTSLDVSTPTAGATWRANFCRAFGQEADQFSCWSPIYGSFHNWPFFGRLQFE